MKVKFLWTPQKKSGEGGGGSKVVVLNQVRWRELKPIVNIVVKRYRETYEMFTVHLFDV